MKWLSIILFLIVGGCVRKSPLTQSTHDYQKPVTVSIAEPLQTINWVLAENESSKVLAHFIGEGLTLKDSEQNIVPALAERWEWSPDGRTLRYFLRKCFWSDGEALKAQHFVESWAALPPQTEFLKSIERSDDGKIRVEAPEDRILVVHLTRPTPHFPFYTALPVSFPHRMDLLESDSEYLTPLRLRNLGKYRLKSFSAKRADLEPNPYYWDGPPTPSHLTLLMP